MADHSRSRSLRLHVSALNDAEYDLYTSSFKDLIDDDNYNHRRIDDSQYDTLTVAIREARAWLRGRYSDIPSSDIDTILRIISPNNDSISGAQFFAVMRLIMHTRSGSPPDSSLVFVQASVKASAQKLPPKHPHPPPPPHDRSHPIINGLPPVLSSASAPAPLPPKPIVLPRSQNPPSHTPLVPPIVPPKPNNPFVNRSRSQDPAPIQNHSLISAKPRTVLIDGKQPPLPPRKPSAPPPPPPRHVPGFPPQPSVFPPSGKTSVLIQQSLQATRIGQSLKKADERLQQERAFEVLKTSTVNGKRTRSISPIKDVNRLPSPPSSSSGASSSAFGASSVPTLPPRRKAPTPPSPIESYRSLEQIATASLGGAKSSFVRDQAQQLDRFSSGSPFHSPPKPTVDLTDPPESPSASSRSSQPPPTHPDRKPTKSLDGDHSNSNPASPTTMGRLFRSKSMHQTSPPPIPPPSHRRRPESVQLTPTSPGFPPLPNLNPSPSYPSSSSHKHSLSRHLSLSSPMRNKDRDPTSLSDSPMAGLHKTFTQLQARAQPRIDAARYKAEAGLSRRGFVSHSNQGGRWLREDVEDPLIDDSDVLPTATPNRSLESLDDETGSEYDRNWDERLKKIRANFEKREKSELVSNKVSSSPWVEEDRDPVGDGWKLLP